MNPLKRFLAVFVWGTVAGQLLLGCQVSGAADARFARSTLTIETASGVHEFRVELALTPSQHAQGLMFRQRMAPDAGMLFVYNVEEVVTMWMRNTFIPLDMVFIDSRGRIAHIAERTVPQSEAVISSGGPVVAVLELNAGTASRLKLRPGDRVRSPALVAP